MAPWAMLLTPSPDMNSAPPVDTWMMPSALAVLRPSRTALAVSVEVTLKAGKAYFSCLARSSILRIDEGFTTGMGCPFEG